MKTLKGCAHKYGDDIDTDAIIAAKYLVTVDAKELGAHCFEILDSGFTQKVKPGDFVVAGKNFGMGSSREHAPLALIGAGVSCVIAKSFARIFYRNSINIGLPILESEEASVAVANGDMLEVDLAGGLIKNLTKNEIYKTKPFPAFMQEIVNAGGLMSYVKKRLGAKKEGVLN